VALYDQGEITLPEANKTHKAPEGLSLQVLFFYPEHSQTKKSSPNLYLSSVPGLHIRALGAGATVLRRTGREIATLFLDISFFGCLFSEK
jgi:hypothetical protein